MEWITLITNLLQLVPVPGASQAAVFAPIVLDLIAQIKSQTGMTTEQILDRAQVTLDENKRMLLEDLDRLRPGGPVLPS
jgi:hypothetical protein